MKLALWNEWAFIWKAITYPCPNLEKRPCQYYRPRLRIFISLISNALSYVNSLWPVDDRIQGISSNDIDSESLWWCQNACDSVSNHQPNDCLLTFIQTQIKESITAPCHWPLCREFTGHRWILRTNGQSRRKCFHLMTSSWFRPRHRKVLNMCRLGGVPNRGPTSQFSSVQVFIFNKIYMQ